MDLFKDIVNESLLLELRQEREADIIDAINNVLRVRMAYNDRKGGKGKNERFILPVAFGLTKSGKKAVRAYETMGSSKRGLTTPPNNRKFPKWKLFLLDNIIYWSNGKRSFKDYKDALVRQGLNLYGDKSMTTLYAITPLAKGDVQVAKDTLPIDAKPVTKNDVAPTSLSQNPKTTDKNEFEPASVSRNKGIDNSSQNSYFKNKVEAPDTEPVTKADIGGAENSPQSMTQITAPETEPITKADITPEPETDIEKVKNNFNDMMNRMDNLNKDNEEENED